MKILVRLILLCLMPSATYSESLLFRCVGAMGGDVRIDYQNMVDYKVGEVYVEGNKIAYNFRVDDDFPGVLYFSSEVPGIVGKNNSAKEIPIIEKSDDKIIALNKVVNGFWLYVIYPKSKVALYLNADSSGAIKKGAAIATYAKCE